MSEDHGRRQSARAGIENWRRSELGMWSKLGLAVRNNWRKARTGRSCCGHPGEPGC